MRSTQSILYKIAKRFVGIYVNHCQKKHESKDVSKMKANTSKVDNASNENYIYDSI